MAAHFALFRMYKFKLVLLITVTMDPITKLLDLASRSSRNLD